MQNPSNKHQPTPGGLPFNNLPGPLSAKEALTLPGDNIFKRMYWASLMFAVALKAQATKHMTGMVIQQNALEEEIEKEMSAHKKHHKRKGHIGRQDGGPGHEEGFDAGEIDQNDNGPEVPEMYKNHDTTTKEHWLIRLIRIYYMSFVLIYNMMGMKRDEKGELTDKALDDWLVINQNKLEFRHLKLHLLNNLSEHSVEFNLTQIEFAERFMNRLAATLFINGKTTQDLQAVNQQELGHAVASAFAQQMKEMSGLANEMVKEATNGLNAAGVNVKSPTPTPTPTPATLNRAVAAMGPAEHPGDHAQQLSMERIATVKTMFPTVPKPQNAQRREHAHHAAHKRSHAKHTHGDHALAKFNTNEAMAGELAQYANAIGVDPRVLEQAADHTRAGIFGHDGPEHAAHQKMMLEMTSFQQSSTKKPPLSGPMTPPPPGANGRGS